MLDDEDAAIGTAAAQGRGSHATRHASRKIRRSRGG